MINVRSGCMLYIKFHNNIKNKSIQYAFKFQPFNQSIYSRAFNQITRKKITTTVIATVILYKEK